MTTQALRVAGALLLQRCTLEVSRVPLTCRPVPLNTRAVQPGLQFLALLAGGAVGGHSHSSLRLGLQGMQREEAGGFAGVQQPRVTTCMGV